MIEINDLITALYYLSYRAEIRYSEKDNIFIGQLVNIENEIMTFNGSSAEELKLAFKKLIDDYLDNCENLHIKLQEPIIEKIFLDFKDDPFVWRKGERHFLAYVEDSKGNYIKEYSRILYTSELSEEYDNKRKQHEEQIRQSTNKIRLDIAVKGLTNNEKRQKNIRDYYRKVEGIYKEKIDKSLWIKAGEFYLWIWETYEDLQEKIPEEYKPLKELFFSGSFCGRISPKPLTEAELLRERIRQLETQVKYLEPAAEKWNDLREKNGDNVRKTPKPKYDY